jgi:integrase
MNHFNSKNERIKRDFYRYQTQAKQKSEKTLDGIRKAIDRFESYTNHKDFSTFNIEQAIAFKKFLSLQKSKTTKENLSKSTILSTVNHLKEFFTWLAWRPGFKSKLHPTEVEYFNLSEKEISIAKAPKYKSFPSLEQIRKTIFAMPFETIIERRDRALLAFTILSGMRDSAIASLKIKHVYLHQDPILIFQSPDEVKTKFSKQISTHFLPIGDDIKTIFIDWMQELNQKELFGPNDPVFPKTKLTHNYEQSFIASGLDRTHWSNASPIRAIFKFAFENARFPYFSPHRFRDTLVQFGQQHCKTPEQFKAFSQTLGHESPMTTFTSYGYIDPVRQGEIILKLKNENLNPNQNQEIIRFLYEKFK